MPSKKNESKKSKTTEKIKKHGASFIKESNARSVVISGKDGQRYAKLNALVALILTLLLPYVAVVVLIIALFGGLDIEIVKKEEKKATPKKKTTPKKETKTIAKK